MNIWIESDPAGPLNPYWLKAVKLQPLPGVLPDVRETESFKVYPDFAVRFDANSYTVPPWSIGKIVTLKADSHTVTIYLKDKKIAAPKWIAAIFLEVDY